MNRKLYQGDPRYSKVLEQMDLLQITDITTTRQHKNGTVVWRLPIKNNNSSKTLIEVASFSTGYVRNQNSGYSNYQLNKRCESEPEYFKLSNGDYRKFETRGCKLIPIEIDRLEYLISYCLKNYYIKRANQVVDGKYVSQWYHDFRVDQAKCNTEAECLSDSDDLTRTVIKLEEKLFDMTEKYNSYKKEYKNRSSEVNDLQNKLEKVKTQCNSAYDCGLSDGKAKANETYSENTGAMARIGELEDRVYELESQVKVADAKRHELHDLQNKLATIKRIATI